MPVREAANEAADCDAPALSPDPDTRAQQSQTSSSCGLRWAEAPAALQTHGLTKHYPVPRQKAKRIAVDCLNLAVPAGEIFGFLGPNGAGKTTTIKILLGFTRPTAGTASLFGRPIEDDGARADVGYVPEQPYFPKFLTVLEVVRAHASLAGVPLGRMKSRAEECLRKVRMDEHRYTPLAKLSKGMTQRVGLATALVGDPKLLILDEPSSGLDPVGRKELRDLLQGLKAEGKTIFLSSHLLSEMEAMCDRVGVLSVGKLVACGRPADIVQTRDESTVEIEPADPDEALIRQVAGWGGTVESAPDGQITRLTVPNEQIWGLFALLKKRSNRLVGVAAKRETLEDAFLRLVGEEGLR